MITVSILTTSYKQETGTDGWITVFLWTTRERLNDHIFMDYQLQIRQRYRWWNNCMIMYHQL